MTHEYKHKVDLSRLDAQFSSCELPDAHEFMRMGCGAEMAFVFRSAPDILAYARELEERVAKMQEAGDNMEQWLGFDIDYDSKAIDVVAEAWRKA